MKIIYHDCTDGCITEVVFAQTSEYFEFTIDAFKRIAELFGDSKIRDVPQEHVKHNCTRASFVFNLN